MCYDLFRKAYMAKVKKVKSKEEKVAAKAAREAKKAEKVAEVVAATPEAPVRNTFLLVSTDDRELYCQVNNQVYSGKEVVVDATKVDGVEQVLKDAGFQVVRK